MRVTLRLRILTIYSDLAEEMEIGKPGTKEWTEQRLIAAKNGAISGICSSSNTFASGWRSKKNEWERQANREGGYPLGWLAGWQAASLKLGFAYSRTARLEICT